jgi:ornithine cyclodeaminase
MTTVLTDADLERLPTMKIALGTMERAFQMSARGELISPPRHHVSFGKFGDLVFTIGGSIGNEPAAGFRAYDTFGGGDRTQIVAVWSAASAELQGIVLGRRLGEIRTGAIGGIAIKYMSAPDANQLGLIGTGHQARTQLEAAASVRDLELVRVYSRAPEKRSAFAAEMQRRLNMEVRPVESAQAAVEAADIVICATTSPVPVLATEWLKPGTHINAVGPKTRNAHELGADIADKVDIVATDSVEQIQAFSEPFFLADEFSEDRVIDLADIVAGRTEIREQAQQTTLFCSTGLAGTEVLLASEVVAAHRKKERR